MMTGHHSLDLCPLPPPPKHCKQVVGPEEPSTASLEMEANQVFGVHTHAADQRCSASGTESKLLDLPRSQLNSPSSFDLVEQRKERKNYVVSEILPTSIRKRGHLR